MSGGHTLTANDQDPQLVTGVGGLTDVTGKVQRQIGYLTVGNGQSQLIFQVFTGLF